MAAQSYSLMKPALAARETRRFSLMSSFPICAPAIRLDLRRCLASDTQIALPRQSHSIGSFARNKVLGYTACDSWLNVYPWRLTSSTLQ